MNLRQKKEAFTLLELVVVAVIIGALALLFGRGILRRWEKIKVNQTKATLTTIKGAVFEYYGDKGKMPTDLDEVQPYLDSKEVPKDAWGNEFEYNAPPVRYKEEGYKKYELFSTGSDGEESDDDIHTGE